MWPRIYFMHTRPCDHLPVKLVFVDAAINPHVLETDISLYIVYLALNAKIGFWIIVIIIKNLFGKLCKAKYSELYFRHENVS